MSQDELFINGELLRLSREARGWVLNDMATRACMSVKQIRQLEEGGMSSFYSVAVKATAAKKVAALLGVSADEVFGRTSDSEAAAHDTESARPHAEAHLPDPVAEVHAETVTPYEPDASVVAVQHPEDELAHANEVSDNAEPKSKTSLLTIAVLFAVALAAAAYLQPKEEVAVEAAPPVQVLPADATDAASAASAPEVAASGVEVAASAPAVAAKPAPVTSASATASAPVLARPASAAAVLPAASAASKAP